MIAIRLPALTHDICLPRYVPHPKQAIVTPLLGLAAELPRSTIKYFSGCGEVPIVAANRGLSNNATMVGDVHCKRLTLSAKELAAAKCSASVLVLGLSAYETANAKGHSGCGCSKGDAIESECCDRYDPCSCCLHKDPCSCCLHKESVLLLFT